MFQSIPDSACGCICPLKDTGSQPHCKYMVFTCSTINYYKLKHLFGRAINTLCVGLEIYGMNCVVMSHMFT